MTVWSVPFITMLRGTLAAVAAFQGRAPGDRN